MIPPRRGAVKGGAARARLGEGVAFAGGAADGSHGPARRSMAAFARKKRPHGMPGLKGRKDLAVGASPRWAPPLQRSPSGAEGRSSLWVPFAPIGLWSRATALRRLTPPAKSCRPFGPDEFESARKLPTNVTPTRAVGRGSKGLAGTGGGAVRWPAHRGPRPAFRRGPLTGEARCREFVRG